MIPVNFNEVFFVQNEPTANGNNFNCQDHCYTLSAAFAVIGNDIGQRCHCSAPRPIGDTSVPNVIVLDPPAFPDLSICNVPCIAQPSYFCGGNYEGDVMYYVYGEEPLAFNVAPRTTTTSTSQSSTTAVTTTSVTTTSSTSSSVESSTSTSSSTLANESTTSSSTIGTTTSNFQFNYWDIVQRICLVWNNSFKFAQHIQSGYWGRGSTLAQYLSGLQLQPYTIPYSNLIIYRPDKLHFHHSIEPQYIYPCIVHFSHFYNYY
ncbi:uncharacterized protein CTRU02_201253 [Colletotrichum truncatum]|uniref:Uncharacterized protein n=1 Tax=Colletotrichum truncatum TaxID=5467 RepID=A0ACC3ZGT7_COLTU|nr:uncharacterized protein CTRU02_08043 [Colletotrichum truncatum]KAF6790523.1 hypothetical protein CTRU02_08043 [Colletotrichum truncatum]